MSVLFVEKQSSVSDPPSGGLRAYICDSSLACWKARSRLPIGYWTLFASSYSWGTASENTSKSAFSEGGLVTLRLNIKLKGYVYHQNLYTAWYGNGSATTLLLDVFTQRNFVADFIRLNLNIIHKNDQFAFWATLWGVRSNYVLCLQLVEKRVVSFLLAVIEHFSLALTVEVL